MIILRSVWVWVSISLLVLVWVPIMGIVSLFDRDPGRYKTGRWFRRLGAAMTRVNPTWKIRISGEYPADMRNPYLVIGNHQSLADIPVLSRLPWDMKWVGKESLFSLPVLGWMMKLSRDISVNRESRRSRAQVFLDSKDRISKRVSVIIFAEGTRSPDGRIHEFADGAFSLALKLGVPILPLALDGTFDALPKKSWKFRAQSDIRIHVFDPIIVRDWESGASALNAHIRSMIIEKIASWRGLPTEEVDALAQEDDFKEEILTVGPRVQQ